MYESFIKTNDVNVLKKVIVDRLDKFGHGMVWELKIELKGNEDDIHYLLESKLDTDNHKS